MDNQQYYDKKFESTLTINGSTHNAALEVIETYLDNKPSGSKRKKVSTVERHQAFWHSEFWQTIPFSVFKSESFVLALTRYFSQSVVSNFTLLEQIACQSPLSIKDAVRYSELALKPNLNKWQEVKQLAKRKPNEFGEFTAIIKLLHKEHEILTIELERAQSKLSHLNTIDCLIYISLFAVEKQLIQHVDAVNNLVDDRQISEFWSAFKDILAWNLQNTNIENLSITERCILESIKEHLSPFLFPVAKEKVDNKTYQDLSDLIAKQIAINSFISQSAHAFCFDDSIAFAITSGRAVIEEADKQLRLDWTRDSLKLKLFDGYWLNRGINEAIASGIAEQQIGSLENHDANQMAVINTLSNQLRLIEVYGLNDYLTADSGLRVNLYEALLSLNMMTAFFNKAFIEPYQKHVLIERNCLTAISRLAFEGLMQGENRFPITWSSKKDKINKFKSWTVNQNFPGGNSRAAEAIIDFWSFDLKATAKKLQSKESSMMLMPELYERPIFTLGNQLIQFPWMIALQNNSTAAINNLRRIGARRSETRAETAAIEARLAETLKARGFNVLLNFQPAKTHKGDPGEIDIICALDDQVIVLEVKSTFLRSTKRDAWFHKTRTLRKAGKQVSRKVNAVKQTLLCDNTFRSTLGLHSDNCAPKVTGWIIDTSIENDHQRFSGYLKVSLEEVLIALRDDSYLLSDIANINPEATLYPDGFSIHSFLNIIEYEQVWKTC
ncbi:NERD domain-containing protein [Alteromonas sp. W364]|uniref:NERD domain-containing protein n=1 Tax=Alteromonas sp. W364 TaxID=3075610 RepID=UPI002886D217|nr:NERD domain-containing protein [Alteromonas sp. W364]MDT0628056.1 NERD domain-containing protein [Alteromonas sp. W364]